MEDLELVSFQIISAVGMAKSSYVEAMRAAAAGDAARSEEKMKEGDRHYAQGHDAHMDLITKEANGEGVTPTVILMHAEDQMMAAETVRLMAEENIRLYQRLQALEAKTDTA